MRNYRLELLVCFFLAVTTFAVYWQVGSYEFVNIDDDKYITENHHLHKGLTRESVIWAFTATEVANWHPLTWLSHMVDFQLYGFNPTGHHLTNVFFHLVNTLLLFLVLKWMTGTLWRSGLVAALFALHPLHVESVAWVAERKDVLSTFFWMLTLWAYLGYVKRPKRKRYLLILLPFALGLMAKPMLVTLPFVLLLLDYWPLERIGLGHSGVGNTGQSHPSIVAEKLKTQVFRLLVEKSPLFTLAAVSSVVTFVVQQSGGAVGTLEILPFSLRIANALVSYVIYIIKMIWPQNLAVFYPHPGQSLPMWQAALGGLLLLVISIVVIRVARRYPYLLVGWLWYLGTLVPVIGLVQVGEQAMADRYTYVPFIGLFIMVAWGIPELVRSWRYGKPALALTAASLLVALMVCASLQVKHWKDSLTLFKHAINVTSNNWLAHNNLGHALWKKDKREEAISHFSEALRIRPYHVTSHNNLGLALAEQGRLEDAISHYSLALQIKPDYAEAYNNLGNALASEGRFDEAIRHFSEALKVKPEFAQAHYNLGNNLARQGMIEEAISHFSEALRIEPDLFEAQNKLGSAFEQLGRLEEAISHYSLALQIKPDYAEAHNNLGVALARQGKFEEAISHFSQALRIKPDYDIARRNLGLAKQLTGRVGEVSRPGARP